MTTTTTIPTTPLTEVIQGTINFTVGYLLQIVPPLPARDDTIEARVEAELERIRIIEATVRRWWRLT